MRTQKYSPREFVYQARAKAWRAALKILKPTRRELDVGLALHREIGVVDGFGFLPRLGQRTLECTRRKYLRLGFSKAESFQLALADINAFPGLNKESAGLARSVFSHAGVALLVASASDIGEDARFALINIAAHQQFCRTTSGFRQVDGSRGAMEANACGEVAVVFSMNGYAPMDAPADRERFFSSLSIWRRLGVRFMHLGYNNKNLFCDGCKEASDGGLSDLGRELIARQEALGIIPDLSHAGEKAIIEAALIVKAPFVVTHAGCLSLFDHVRCKSDRALKAVADAGGTFGIYTVPSLLGKTADLRHFFAHLQHAIKVIGCRHVSIGTDFSINPEYAQKCLKSAWERHEQRELSIGSLAWSNLPLITVGLVQSGYSENQIRQIFRTNVLRVLAAHEDL